MSASAPTRTAPLALWRIAETFLRTLHALFGAPEEIAAQHTLTTQPYALLLSWLRAGEALMRRLLLIEAASFAKPNTRPLLHKTHKRTRKLVGFDADKPAKWRVSFRCFAQTDRRLPAGKVVPLTRVSQAETFCRLEAGGPRRFHSAWPLAERYEALLRVFNAPCAYAARLARRLFATPHRGGELRAHAKLAASLIGEDSFAEISAAAIAAQRHFDSS